MGSGATTKQAQAVADVRTALHQSATLLELAAHYIRSTYHTGDDSGRELYFWARQMDDQAGKLWRANESAHDSFPDLFENAWTDDGVYRLKAADGE